MLLSGLRCITQRLSDQVLHLILTEVGEKAYEFLVDPRLISAHSHSVYSLSIFIYNLFYLVFEKLYLLGEVYWENAERWSVNPELLLLGDWKNLFLCIEGL